MGRRNYNDEKANEEYKSMHIGNIVGLVIMFGALIMAALVLTM